MPAGLSPPEGTPEAVAGVAGSHTGFYLAPMLGLKSIPMDTAQKPAVKKTNVKKAAATKPAAKKTPAKKAPAKKAPAKKAAAKKAPAKKSAK